LVQQAPSHQHYYLSKQIIVVRHMRTKWSLLITHFSSMCSPYAFHCSRPLQLCFIMSMCKAFNSTGESHTCPCSSVSWQNWRWWQSLVARSVVLNYADTQVT